MYTINKQQVIEYVIQSIVIVIQYCPHYFSTQRCRRAVSQAFSSRRIVSDFQ